MDGMQPYFSGEVRVAYLRAKVRLYFTNRYFVALVNIDTLNANVFASLFG
jgi:hypothetical protein